MSSSGSCVILGQALPLWSGLWPVTRLDSLAPMGHCERSGPDQMGHRHRGKQRPPISFFSMYIFCYFYFFL